MKIEKARFLEFGKKAPKGSRFKGVLDSESLVDWFDYTDREEAKENKKTITKHEGGFFGYTSSHSVGTFSSHGELITEKQKNSFKKQIANSFKKNGDIFWDYVVSLEDDQEAELCGLDTSEQWLNVVNQVMPKIAKEYKIDMNNINWWFDVHRNTDHPHIHLVFLEKKQTRTRGKISKQQLANTKRFFWTEIAARKKLQERVQKDYKDFFKDKDLVFDELVTKIDQDILKQKRIPLNGLYKILPKTGRLQYNSFHMKEFRPIIDKIIDDIIYDTPELKKQIDNFIEKIEILESTINEVGNSKVSTIKEAEMKKLYERVGNIILKNYKKKEIVDLDLTNTTIINEVGITNDFQTKKSDKGDMATLPSKQQPKRIVRRKFLTKKRLKNEISQAAYNQQREIEKALDEFYARYEENLIV